MKKLSDRITSRKLERTRRRLYKDLASYSPLYQIHLAMKELDLDYHERADRSESLRDDYKSLA